MQRIHFMGIAGSGMSAVAELAKAKGYIVTGCDEETGGHSPSHLTNVDLLCVTPSVFYLNNHNEEMEFARENNIPIMTWQKFMGEILFKDKFTIAVAGTHGKTTTTGLVGFLLETAGFDPWVEVGGVVKNWKANYRISQNNNKYFVCEADEFYDNFLNIHADVILLNNIEFDHPEFFGTEEKMYESFVKFINNMKMGGRLIVNTDNAGIAQLLNPPARFAARRAGEAGCSIAGNVNIIKIDNNYIDINQSVFGNMQIFGRQNVRNAAGILKLGEILNIDKKKIIRSFADFQGMIRRQDLIGEVGRIKIFDDYAHHPTAIRETIAAFKTKYPQDKIAVVIEPHTYSRLKYLYDDFLRAADLADLTIYTDVFESREKDKPTVTSQNLVSKINRQNVLYLPFHEVNNYLEKNIKSGIIIFMGAGNINKISHQYNKYLCRGSQL